MLSLINGRSNANGTHPSVGIQESLQDTNGGGGRRSHVSSSSGQDLMSAQLPAGGNGISARRALGNSCVHHTRIASPDGCVWESPAAIECADGGGLYDLTGVCYHLGGSLESGHYVAAVKGPSDQWWECNDELCSPVESDSVASGRYLVCPFDLLLVLLWRRIMMWLCLHRIPLVLACALPLCNSPGPCLRASCGHVCKFLTRAHTATLLDGEMTWVSLQDAYRAVVRGRRGRPGQSARGGLRFTNCLRSCLPSPFAAIGAINMPGCSWAPLREAGCARVDKVIVVSLTR